MESFLKTGKLGSGSPGQASLFKKTKTEPSGRPSALVPWVEKYRPKTITDVAYQVEVVEVLKRSLEGSDLPNLLFYGPPGTGKTSTILAAARDLFGDIYKQRILELNASDERGISVVRDKVKRFAQLTASGKRPDGKPCPPYKIIILDEADSMTRDAQSALRRTMEKEGKSTKFCLICNYVSRIIEPLTSRCAKFRFKPLANDILVGRLKMIAEKEDVHVSSEAFQAILDTSEGDLRKAITTLQSAAKLHGETASDKGTESNVNVSENDICDIAGVVPDKWIEKLFEACRSNQFENLESLVNDITCEGFSGTQLLNQLHDRIVITDDFTDLQKSIMCEKLAVCSSRLLDGANEYLQMVDLCSTIMKTNATAA